MTAVSSGALEALGNDVWQLWLLGRWERPYTM